MKHRTKKVFFAIFALLFATMNAQADISLSAIELLAALSECERIEDFCAPNPAIVLTACDRVIAEQPDGFQNVKGKIHLLRGDALLLLLRPQEATASYRQAIKSGSQHTEALLMVSIMDQPFGETDSPDIYSKRYLQIIEKVGPDKSAAGLYGELARLAERSGQRERADEYLRLGRERNAEDGWFLDCECAVLIARGKGRDAIDRVDQFLEKYPNSTRLQNLIVKKAEALLSLGQPRKALTTAIAANKFAKWPGQRPAKVDAYFVISRAALALDKPATALFAAIEANKIYNRSVASQLLQTAALCRLDRVKEALVSAKRGILLAPDNLHCQLALGDVHKLLGQDSDAMKHYQRTLELDPKCLAGILRYTALIATSHVQDIADSQKATDLLESGVKDPDPVHRLRWLFTQAHIHCKNHNTPSANQNIDEANQLVAKSLSKQPLSCRDTYLVGKLTQMRHALKDKKEPVPQLYITFEYLLD